MLRLFLLLSLFLPSMVQAQSTDYGTVKLLRGWQLEDGTFQMALEFNLNPGWKTYWRSPGPAGLPPVFTWDGSSNIENISYAWPTPEVIDQDGMITLGYHGNLVLPIRVTPEADGPVRIALILQFGVCSDICVPAEAVFITQLNGSAQQGVEQIEAALQNAPQTPENAGLQNISCAVVATDSGYDIKADLAFDEAISAPFMVIEYATQDIWIDMVDSSAVGAVISASAPMKYYGSGEMNIDMNEVTVSVFGADRAVEINGCSS